MKKNLALISLVLLTSVSAFSLELAGDLGNDDGRAASAITQVLMTYNKPACEQDIYQLVMDASKAETISLRADSMGLSAPTIGEAAEDVRLKAHLKEGIPFVKMMKDDILAQSTPAKLSSEAIDQCLVILETSLDNSNAQ